MNGISSGFNAPLRWGSTIARETYEDISWGFNRFSKLTDKTLTTRNLLSSAIGFTIFFQKMPHYLKELPANFQNFAPVKWLSDSIVPESLSFYKGRLEAFKDPLTILDFFATTAEVSNPEFWAVDEKTHAFRNSISKIGNRCTKVIYTGLEGLLILPNKWNLIDLGSWCESIGTWSTNLAWVTPTNIFIVKEGFVVTSATFGIWNASEEINKSTGVVQKNKGRMDKLEAIKIALLTSQLEALGTEGEVDSQATADSAKAYEAGKTKIPVLVKTYKDILKLHDDIADLQITIEDLLTDYVKNADQILAKNQAMDKKRRELNKLEEKVRRIAYFAAPLIGGSQEGNAIRIILNEYYAKAIKASLNLLTDQNIKNYITDNLEDVTQKGGDAFEFLDQNILEPLSEQNPDHPDYQILDDIWDSMDDINTLLNDIALPLDNETEGDEKLEKFEQILNYKITKASIRITLNESQETKSRITRWFEISKIAIVTLGLLVVTGLTLSYLASFAAAIALASWVTGLGVSVVGLTKTIYDTFYWKDPKDVSLPTTSLA